MVRHENTVKLLILTLLAGTALVQRGIAQTPTGTVQGTVKDKSGASIQFKPAA